MPFSDLEVCLLDVGRFVALSGYAPACLRLAFVSPDFYREDDYLVAGKHVRYGDLRRTRLMSLARKGDLPRVSLLLDVGAKVNAADEDGMTPLLLASERGHASVVEVLLHNGADVDAEDALGRTALHHASRGGHVDVVRLLLGTGKFDVNAEDDKKLAPLLYAEKYGHHGVTQLLRGAGAKIEKTDEDGMTVLGRALDRGDMESVRRLIDLGAAVLNKHITHFQRACVEGNEQLVCLLLNERARVKRKRDWNLEAIYEAEDKHGTEVRMTVLHHAVRNGHRDVVDLLVKAGADVNAEGFRYTTDTVLDWAFERRDTRLLGFLVDLGARFEPSSGIDNLNEACSEGNLKLVRALVIKAGVDVNGSDYEGIVPLHCSEAAGHRAITRFLHDNGADMDCGENEPVLNYAVRRGSADSVRCLVALGASPSGGLGTACEKGNEAIVRLLVGLGASPSFGLRSACWKGNVAMVRLLLDLGANPSLGLRAACREGKEAVVRLLLDLGADVNAKDDDDDDTALHCAETRGHRAITRLLRDKGADLEAPGYAGKTVLACAIEKGDAASVRRLVALGASPSGGLSFARGAGHAAMVKLLLELGGGEGAAAGAAGGV